MVIIRLDDFLESKWNSQANTMFVDKRFVSTYLDQMIKIMNSSIMKHIQLT